MQGTENFMG
jgi:hypothetical protein